jgi:alpha-galactosidase/6-phospho-beta-glucosidase family protein
MKVTFVRGGSLVWSTDLLTDMALNASLHGATVALQDIDQPPSNSWHAWGGRSPIRNG